MKTTNTQTRLHRANESGYWNVKSPVWIAEVSYKTRTLTSLPTPRNTFTSVDS